VVIITTVAFLFSCLALEEERHSFVDLLVTAATESERALPYADEEPPQFPSLLRRLLAVVGRARRMRVRTLTVPIPVRYQRME
jgi:hypothetical protein